MKERVKGKPKERRVHDSDSSISPMSVTLLTKETVVIPMKSKEAIILVNDLLGNFSDQTGASFG
jgi:hypothetical protein